MQTQRPRVSARPHHIPIPDEVTIKQKPRITVSTTPATLYQIQTQANGKLEGPPATTYRPAIQFFSQKSTPTPSQLIIGPNKQTHFGTTRRPVDFAAEFQKFQQENNLASTTSSPPRTTNPKTYGQQSQKIELPHVTPNPIYETQLVFDPQTGQIDSSLFPQNVAYRIPAAYVSAQQQAFSPSPQVVTLEQIQQQNLASTTRSPLQLPQFSQQVNIKI